MSQRVADISRRGFCAAVLGSLGAVAAGSLAGCSSSNSDTVQGFASDTEVKSGELTVYIIADANLKRGFATSETGRLEDYFARYQTQAGREQVTFAIKYKSAAELEELMASGFKEGDAVVALEDAVEEGSENGVVYGGKADTSIREFTAQLNEKLVVVRKAGGKVEMPKADTLTGEDSEDGQISRMQNLPDFDGRIAVASDALTEGMLANRVLARWGYYSKKSGVGVTYKGGIEDKVVVCESIEELSRAVARGTCKIGFGLQSMLWGDYPELELLYEPAFGTLTYAGASLPDSDAGGVARDFFEYITRCV